MTTKKGAKGAKVIRSSITGRFVSAATAKRHPKQTVVSVAKKKRRKR